MPIISNEKEVDMCRAVEELIADSRAEGRSGRTSRNY